MTPKGNCGSPHLLALACGGPMAVGSFSKGVTACPITISLASLPLAIEAMGGQGGLLAIGRALVGHPVGGIFEDMDAGR